MAIAARLDEIGRPAWIAVMVLGFVVFWPVGLAVLGFLLWSGRMGMGCAHGGRWGRWKHDRWARFGHEGRRPFGRYDSGNSAFDEYKADTLRRLEEEQTEFLDFLQRLRHAKDKVEFDQFMAERRNRPQTPPATPSPDGEGQ
ncbi:MULTISPECIES: DUF2852 domain-containing protein [Rhodomicrobium]|uniref:DUF2852 domain-containing protein n=1 Tax=Rhodomicrobium TaxID=1068 RepID=UPI000B4B2D68|nr:MULTISPECIES: DUF2852 domain-containing protein [Rhodomicrobium]